MDRARLLVMLKLRLRSGCYEEKGGWYILGWVKEHYEQGGLVGALMLVRRLCLLALSCELL